MILISTEEKLQLFNRDLQSQEEIIILKEN